MEGVRRIPKIELTPGKLIGQGGFGSVLQGEYRASSGGGKCSTVALKILHSPIRSEKYAEFIVMSQFKHRNLVALLGIVESESNACPELVLQFMPNGSLLDFVRKNNCSKSNIMKIGFDIINGMEYLHNMGYLHRILAARNILLDANHHAKITDFGLSRVIDGQGSNYYKIDDELVLPIRWVPKECIPSNSNPNASHTQEADVWAFGVVVWEVATRGDVPYGAASSNTQVRQMIQNGSNPLKESVPDHCPADVIKIMEFIFVDDPSKRPTFMDLRKTFEGLQEQEKEAKAMAVPGTEDSKLDTEDAGAGAGTTNPKKKRQRAKKNTNANGKPDVDHEPLDSSLAKDKPVNKDQAIKKEARPAQLQQPRKKFQPPQSENQGRARAEKNPDRNFKGPQPPQHHDQRDQHGRNPNAHGRRPGQEFHHQKRDWKEQQPQNSSEKGAHKKDNDYKPDHPSFTPQPRPRSHKTSREPSPPRPANEYERLNQQPPIVYNHPQPAAPGASAMLPSPTFMNPMMMQMPMAAMAMPMYPQMAQMGFPYAGGQMPLQVTVNQASAPAPVAVDKSLEEEVKKLQEKVKELELEKKKEQLQEVEGKPGERSHPRDSQDSRPQQHFDQSGPHQDQGGHQHHFQSYAPAKASFEPDYGQGQVHGRSQVEIPGPPAPNIWIPSKEPQQLQPMVFAQTKAQAPSRPPPKQDKVWNPFSEAAEQWEKTQRIKQEQEQQHDRHMVGEVTAAAVSAAVKGAIRAAAATSSSDGDKSDTKN